jgi:lysozyme family protein
VSENSLKAIGKVLKIEGGFTDGKTGASANDAGGATNFGITQKVYEDFVGREVSVDEIRNMPEGDAYQIYKENYWDAIGGDSITEYAVAYIIFDQAVNRGVSSALKQACRTVGIPESGGVNSYTISKVNAYDSFMFVYEYINYSEDFYNQLVINKPTNNVFLKGWLNRCDKIRTYAEAQLGKTIAVIEDAFNDVTDTVEENPWIWAVPALAMIGIIVYYQMNKNKKYKTAYA